MSSVRVILADTEENYIHSLQIRFAESFRDRIDLEVITDPDYYADLFELPQQVDILVVEEKLYDPSLLRHGIGNIFVLTRKAPEHSEETDGEDTWFPPYASPSHVTQIYKYTSIPEVFREITGRSGLDITVSAETGKTQIILVTSASGGVGKTTAAMALSICLSRNYKRVLYLGAQRLQNFQHLLEHAEPISEPAVYDALSVRREGAYPELQKILRREEFWYLPPFKASLLSLGIPFSVYLDIALSAKESGEYDFIVIDAENSFDEEHQRLSMAADHVLLVLTRNAGAAAAAQAYVSNVGGTDSDKYIFLCNEYRIDRNHDFNHPEASFPYAEGFIPVYSGTDSAVLQSIVQDETMRRISCMLL